MQTLDAISGLGKGERFASSSACGDLCQDRRKGDRRTFKTKLGRGCRKWKGGKGVRRLSCSLHRGKWFYLGRKRCSGMACVEEVTEFTAEGGKIDATRAENELEVSQGSSINGLARGSRRPGKGSRETHQGGGSPLREAKLGELRSGREGKHRESQLLRLIEKYWRRRESARRGWASKSGLDGGIASARVSERRVVPTENVRIQEWGAVD